MSDYKNTDVWNREQAGRPIAADEHGEDCECRECVLAQDWNEENRRRDEDAKELNRK